MKRTKLIKTSFLAAASLAFSGFLFAAKSGESPPGARDDHPSGSRLKAVVELEEKVYGYKPADNGSSPMWCKGSTPIVRIGDRVVASGLETIPEWIPLNNCRWLLFERASDGWKQRFTDHEGRTREPSPLAAFHDGSVFVSANPALTGPDERGGPARPEIYLFKESDIRKPIDRILPGWAGNPTFFEHSYRSFAADGARRELIIFQNVRKSHAEWAFRDSSGNWSAQGRFEWPFGAGYETPRPIPVSYPAVALRDRSVYYFGISNTPEPKEAWRDYKRQITGRDWDFDRRRLFLTWSDDITSGIFHPWIEIASREETCGWMKPHDLWVAPDGAVHLLWNERAIDERLREKFFPGARQSHAMNHAIFRKGRVEHRQSLILAEEGTDHEMPVWARFHITPEHRLLVVYCISRRDRQGRIFYENRVMELSHKGVPGSPVTLRLKSPFTDFFLPTIRAGSTTSDIIDMFGTIADAGPSIHYARIRIY